MIEKIQYCLGYAYIWVHSKLPFRVLYVLSDILYVLVYLIVGYRRKVVRRNLKVSFPEKSKSELRKVERGFYHFFCDYIVETMKLMTITPEEMKRRMVFKGLEQLEADLSSGRSCAAFLGHYCNWEWVSSLPLNVKSDALSCQIYHPLENKATDRLFLGMRSRMGAVSIAMNDTIRKFVEYKRDGKVAVTGFIADQVPHWANIHWWCDFLNHDTPVLTGTEKLAKRFDQAVYYIDVRRIRRGYYEAEFHLLTEEPKKYEDYEITSLYFKELEKSIRRAPEFWLWSHNRWKRDRQGYKEWLERNEKARNEREAK